MTRLQTAFAAIDQANSADPNQSDGLPVELLYGQRMTEEQLALYPDASEPLRIACRGQHIERWTLPRHDFPMDRPGYLAWRTEQGRRHAARVAEIMRAAGQARLCRGLQRAVAGLALLADRRLGAGALCRAVAA